MSAFPDWTQINPVDDFPLSLADDPEFNWSSPSLLRNYVLDLAEIEAALSSRNEPQAGLRVFSDVLRLGKSHAFSLPNVFIHSRRIEIPAGATLEIQAPPEASSLECAIEIYAAEWALESEARGARLIIGGESLPLSSLLNGGGISARIAPDGSVSIKEKGKPAAGDATAGQLHLDFARRTAHDTVAQNASDFTLPLAIADWLAKTGGAPLLQVDANRFAAHLRSPQARAYPVPALRMDSYRQLATDTRDALKQVEDMRDSLFKCTLGLDRQKSDAQNLLDHHKAEKRKSLRVLKQVDENLQAAQSAQTQSQSKVDDASAELDALEAAFREGVEKKKSELKRKAALGVCLAVIEIGGGIALACMGNPAGAAGAAAAAGKAADATQKAAKTVSKIQRIAKYLSKIGSFLEAMHKIKKYLDMLISVYAAIKDPIAARAAAEKAGQTIPDDIDEPELMSAADWEEMLQTLDDLFEDALSAGISGAAEYKIGLKRFAIRGKDLVNANANLKRNIDESQRVLWDSIRIDEDIATVESFIAQLGDRSRPWFVLYMSYQALRDRLKYRLLHAIEDISNAYRYYALRDPLPPPSFSSNGATLAAALSDIQQELVDSKDKRGAISTWKPQAIQIPKRGFEQFQTRQALSWVLPMDNFPKLELIRIDEIRVWLNGDIDTTEQPIDIRIATSGYYQDRLGKRDFEFAATPLKRAFQYRFDEYGSDRDLWQRPVKIDMHADDREQTYLQPTPFTTWTLSLPQKLNPHLDPRSVKGLALQFFGTAKGKAFTVNRSDTLPHSGDPLPPRHTAERPDLVTLTETDAFKSESLITEIIEL